MNKIIIVGAGGFGRELLMWIKDINKAAPRWTVAGFIDDNLDALDGVACDYPVIGRISDWQPAEDEEFAMALGTPRVKEQVAQSLKARGARFATVIHPTAILSEFARYGEGFVMFPYAKLSCNSAVGDFVTLLSSPIGHDTFIGDYATISGNCNLVRNVVVGKRAFLAAGVCVAQDVHIGDDANVGLGSVVVKNVPHGAHMFGNPARRVPV